MSEGAISCSMIINELPTQTGFCSRLCSKKLKKTTSTLSDSCDGHWLVVNFPACPESLLVPLQRPNRIFRSCDLCRDLAFDIQRGTMGTEYAQIRQTKPNKTSLSKWVHTGVYHIHLRARLCNEPLNNWSRSSWLFHGRSASSMSQCIGSPSILSVGQVSLVESSSRINQRQKLDQRYGQV